MKFINLDGIQVNNKTKGKGMRNEKEKYSKKLYI